MKKILISLLLSLFVLQSLHSSEPSETTDHNKIVRNSYAYFSYGIGFPELPSLNLGYRTQKNSFGFGVQSQVAWFVLPIIGWLDISFSILYYRKPVFDAPQNYFGISAGGLYIQHPNAYMFRNRFVPSGSLFFGREFFKKNGERRFWETYAGFPHGIGFRYGFCF